MDNGSCITFEKNFPNFMIRWNMKINYLIALKLSRDYQTISAFSSLDQNKHETCHNPKTIKHQPTLEYSKLVITNRAFKLQLTSLQEGVKNEQNS